MRRLLTFVLALMTMATSVMFSSCSIGKTEENAVKTVYVSPDGDITIEIADGTVFQASTFTVYAE